ncbi:RNA-binding protein 44 isoform X2 [Perca fluviatilis]|uniref:RNA-binding protein 44 isoform X2 n=1 Tax=Perca fluviatilis TaxID=8168 RepID=UPI001965A9E1|nr:RNA-binding protein 44 isoform X2 [Perca fluviatilis]
MAVYQKVWPAFPITLPYEVTAPSSSYLARDYAGVVVPSHLIPCYYNMAIEKPSQKENRKFLLDRSVFDLVEVHKYLSLTDQRLLGWYLSLLPDDRKIIQDEGGFHQFLHRHPALELTRHHVYVKHNFGSDRTALPTVTSNRPVHVSQSRASAAAQYKFDMSYGHQNLKILPNDVRETLTLLGCRNSGDGSLKSPHGEICCTTRLVHQQDCIQTAFSNPTVQEPNHQKGPSRLMSSSAAALANCSLDMDLERCSKGGKPELSSQTAMTQGRSANFTYEVSPLQSEWTKIESPKYYSFDSIQMDDTEYSDGSIIQAVELEQVSPLLDPVEENGTKEGGQGQEVDGNEYNVDDDDDDAAIFSFGDQSDNFHSIMENDKSILACLPSEDVKARNNGVQSGPLATDGKALAASRETLNSDQSVVKKTTAEKHTSTMPCATTCDVMVGTELAVCMSDATQTENPKTADKHVVTEVHMTDLDYLAEEFLKLKMAQEELRKQKHKRKSLACKVRKECDCIQRAQQAELALLALQYSMCRQHCWRLYYTSAEGGQATPVPNNPPVDIASVLQNLESEYNQMKDKILTGVPLEQLKPLSVDSEKITTCASYIPAQIINDVLGNVPSWSPQEPQKPDTSVEENGCPDDQSGNGCQPSQRKEKPIKEDSKAVSAVRDRGAIHNEHKPAERQTTAECKELNTSEAWYDAEEDVKPAVATQTGQDPTVIAKERPSESASTEVKSSVLCVSNLPSHVTESNVMQWFEKYQVSEVSFPTLKNDVRVAIVVINGHQSAKDAARALHGRCMQGHTLHVEHIHKAIGESQSQASASISGSESSHDADKPQTSKTDSSSTERKLISQPPPSSSVKHRKVVSISPTAKGTCVPQRYGTMGSFDILMSELTQRHPDVERQRIVDALMQLKAKHQGVLSGLPLRTIREMTSELLTTPASDAVERKQSSVL